MVKRPLEIYNRINLIIPASDPDKAKEVIGHEDHKISVEISRIYEYEGGRRRVGT